MISRFRLLFIGCLIASLCAASCSSCESCGAQEDQDTGASAPDTGPAEVDTGSDTNDELEEAKKEAEVLGDQAAFARTTKARFMAAELEGMQKKVEGPKGPSVKTGPAPADRGTINLDKTKKVFRNHRGELQKCYERALKRDPALQGNVTLTVRIGQSGAPSLVKARSQYIHDNATLNCMERAAKKWLFPAPQGGTVLLNKPFKFTPKT